MESLTSRQYAELAETAVDRLYDAAVAAVRGTPGAIGLSRKMLPGSKAHVAVGDDRNPYLFGLSADPQGVANVVLSAPLTAETVASRTAFRSTLLASVATYAPVGNDAVRCAISELSAVGATEESALEGVLHYLLVPGATETAEAIG